MISLKKRLLILFSIFSVALFILFYIIIFNILDQYILTQTQTKFLKISSHIYTSANIDKDIKIAIIKNQKLIPISYDFPLEYKDIKIKVPDSNGSRYVKIPNIKKEHFLVIEDDIFTESLFYFKPLNKDMILVLYKYDIDKDMKNILLKIAIGMIILIILLIFIVYRIVDSIVNPLQKILNSVKHVTINNFNQTIDETSKYIEINSLIVSYNNMIKRVQREIDFLEEFNSDLAHELKNPLTILKGELELSLIKDRDINYYKELLVRLLNETKHIETIINKLLTLSKLQERQKIHKERFLLGEFTKDIASKYVVKIDIIEDFYIVANKSLINLVIINLIENAIKYTTKKDSITITIKKGLLEVSNLAKDINIKDINIIKRRFYQIKKDRNRNKNSIGLGLSIVDKIVTLHNAKLILEYKNNTFFAKINFL